MVLLYLNENDQIGNLRDALAGKLVRIHEPQTSRETQDPRETSAPTFLRITWAQSPSGSAGGCTDSSAGGCTDSSAGGCTDSRPGENP